MAIAFYLGLDVTDEGPYTLSLVEKATDSDREATYAVRRLEEIEASDAGDAIVDHVEDITTKPPFTGRTTIVVNKTSDQGQELLDCFIERGATPIGVRLTGGDTAAQSSGGMARMSNEPEQDQSGFLVSEHDVVDAVQELFVEGRLKLAQNRSENVTLLAEGLQSYRVRASEKGQALEGARETPHRDAAHAGFVLSTGLACWLARQQTTDPAEKLDQESRARDEMP